MRRVSSDFTKFAGRLSDAVRLRTREVDLAAHRSPKLLLKRATTEFLCSRGRSGRRRFRFIFLSAERPGLQPLLVRLRITPAPIDNWYETRAGLPPPGR